MRIVDKINVDIILKFCYNPSMDIKGLEELIREDSAGKFSSFYRLLTEYNNMYNLTSVTEKEEVFYKHFLDSVAAEEYFFNGAEVAEIGSGGGFPSMPLKFIRDDLKFTLIESVGKKCNFLNAVVDKLNLRCVKVLNMRAEDAAKSSVYREKFDVSCARAVAKLNTLSEYCLPFVKIGGRFIAYKGECDDEIKESFRAIKILGGEIEETVKFRLENCGARTLVIIKKIGATPEIYPRGNGKERKKPL